ncbi:MAG: AAA family ATPase [Candidatus Aminicenantales bacterium]
MVKHLKARLIGLTGTNGAGKGEVANFLRKKGYVYYSLSDLVRQKLRREGKELSRNNLIKMGNELREKFGADILARLVVKKIRGKAVIDSIRNPKEVEYLRQQKKFILVAVDAPVALRFKRIKKRGREESVSTLQEFIRKEAEEMSNNQKGQQLQNCIKMADIKIVNKSSLEDLYQKLEKLL